MIQTLIASTGIKAAFKLGRGVILAIIIGSLFGAGGLCFYRGMKAIERMQVQAATAATETAEARAAAALEKSNAEAAAIVAARDIAAAKRDAAAIETISGLQTALNQWETRNAQASGDQAQCLDAAELDDLNRLRGNPGVAATPDRRR